MTSTTDESLGSNAEDHTPSGASSTLPQSDENDAGDHRSHPGREEQQKWFQKWQEQLRSDQKKIKEEGKLIVTYLQSNVWSILPAAVALLLVVLAGQFMAVAHNECNAPGKVDAQGQTLIPRVNPVICPNSEILRDALGGIETTETGKLKYRFPVSVAPARDAHQKELTAAAKKNEDDADAEVKQAQSIREFYVNHPPSSEPNPPTAGSASRRTGSNKPGRSSNNLSAESNNPKVDATKQDADSTKELSQAQNKLSEAKAKLEEIEPSAKAADAVATYTVLLREARARTLWFVSYGLSLAVTLGTIVAMAWVFGTAFGDQWAPSGLPSPEISRRAALFFLMFLSVCVLLLIAWGGYLAVYYLFLSGYNLTKIY
jgi:hypothetical protein